MERRRLLKKSGQGATRIREPVDRGVCVCVCVCVCDNVKDLCVLRGGDSYLDFTV